MNNTISKSIAAAVVVGGMVLSSNAAEAKLTLDGSTTVGPIAKAFAEYLMRQDNTANITVSESGSGNGAKALLNGTCDIANLSRALKSSEKEAMAAKGVKPVAHVVAYDALPVIVHPSNKVGTLTIEQIKDIYTGKITNWKDVGGPDEKIVLVTRPQTSGTRALYKKYAINDAEEASNKSLETDNSGLLVQSVAQNKGAIGYVALPYLMNDKSVVALAIDGVAPTLENTYNGTYSVWGYEHIYTSNEPKAAVKAFIDFILSDKYGQRIEELGYGVGSKMQTKEVH